MRRSFEQDGQIAALTLSTEYTGSRSMWTG